MKTVSTWIGLAVVVAMTVGVGMVHGKYSNRWGKPPDMAGAAERVRGLPETIGDWEMRDSSEFGDNVVKQLQCAGYVNRVYVHRKSGDTVSVAMLVGPPGPISVHTPEVCYPSMNLEILQKAETQKIESDGASNEFSSVLFRSRGLEAEKLRVWYSWANDGRWQVPKLSPRMAFSGSPMLFKIQVAAPVEGDGKEDADPCRAFINDFVPIARNQVFQQQPAG